MSNIRVFDAGNHLVISGDSKEGVQLKLRELEQLGAVSPSEVVRNGDVWVASCENPEVMASTCEVMDIGMNLMITGSTRESVEGKIKELRASGANPITEPELTADGKWVVVCDKSGFRAW